MRESIKLQSYLIAYGRSLEDHIRQVQRHQAGDTASLEAVVIQISELLKSLRRRALV